MSERDGDSVQRQAATGNTGLSRPQEPFLIAAGCDSLYWSAKGEIGAAYGELLGERAKAEGDGGARPWREVNGFTLNVLPRGVGRYRVVLESAEFTIQLTDSVHLPTVYVELRSEFIHEVGLEVAFAGSVAVARSITGVALAEPHVARIDLYADFGNWTLGHDAYAGIVSHAKRHSVASESRSYETIQIGKTPFLVRIYRKDVERRDRQKAKPVSWGDYEGPVVRIETQATTEFLRKLGARTFAEVLESRGDIWRYGTEDFVEIRIVGSGHIELWPVRPEWRLVQAVRIERFPANGLVPFHAVGADRARLLALLYGCLTSLGAIENVTDLRGLLVKLPALLATAVRTRRVFAEEVARKRARLPRTFRSLNVDSLAASAGAEKESFSCASEPSQVNTAGGTQL